MSKTKTCKSLKEKLMKANKRSYIMEGPPPMRKIRVYERNYMLKKLRNVVSDILYKSM